MPDTTSASNSVKCARLKGPPLTQDIYALIGGLILLSALSGCAALARQASDGALIVDTISVNW